ncbi:hypothetical protein LX70_03978 [Defluviimonas denitrificans]|uniref:Uncharacterized protein n=2 Tax=Albidovulum denitrificans TaxID=404881 RepID=A0A2S8RWG9_9RHOB|nr:hypothetical protein LX70_03978 [Defluviimonas denitrificans]
MSRNSEAKHSMDLSKRLWESGNYKLVRLGIRYEAANSFGASIAGAAVCTGPVRDGDDIAEIDPSSLRINGYTSFDWSIAQIGTSN